MPSKTLTKQDQKTLKEAYTAIRRLNEAISHPNNRGGEYSRNCREAIQRWQETIRRIEGEPV